MEGTCQCLEILFLSWKGCVNVSRFYFEHGRDVSVSSARFFTCTESRPTGIVLFRQSSWGLQFEVNLTSGPQPHIDGMDVSLTVCVLSMLSLLFRSVMFLV